MYYRFVRFFGFAASIVFSNPLYVEAGESVSTDQHMKNFQTEICKLITSVECNKSSQKHALPTLTSMNRCIETSKPSNPPHEKSVPKIWSDWCMNEIKKADRSYCTFLTRALFQLCDTSFATQQPGEMWFKVEVGKNHEQCEQTVDFYDSLDLPKPEWMKQKTVEKNEFDPYIQPPCDRTPIPNIPGALFVACAQYDLHYRAIAGTNTNAIKTSQSIFSKDLSACAKAKEVTAEQGAAKSLVTKLSSSALTVVATHIVFNLSGGNPPKNERFKKDPHYFRKIHECVKKKLELEAKTTRLRVGKDLTNRILGQCSKA